MSEPKLTGWAVRDRRSSDLIDLLKPFFTRPT